MLYCAAATIPIRAHPHRCRSNGLLDGFAFAMSPFPMSTVTAVTTDQFIAITFRKENI